MLEGLTPNVTSSKEIENVFEGEVGKAALFVLRIKGYEDQQQVIILFLAAASHHHHRSDISFVLVEQNNRKK